MSLTHVTSAANVVTQARHQFRNSILRARAHGATLQEIADAAGLTKGRISQIVKAEKTTASHKP